MLTTSCIGGFVSIESSFRMYVAPSSWALIQDDKTWTAAFCSRPFETLQQSYRRLATYNHIRDGREVSGSESRRRAQEGALLHRLRSESQS
jgi:hypothetical protein